MLKFRLVYVSYGRSNYHCVTFLSTPLLQMIVSTKLCRNVWHVQQLNIHEHTRQSVELTHVHGKSTHARARLKWAVICDELHDDFIIYTMLHFLAWLGRRGEGSIASHESFPDWNKWSTRLLLIMWVQVSVCASICNGGCCNAVFVVVCCSGGCSSS